MYSYVIILSKKAEKQLDSFDAKTAKPIVEAISSLSLSPRPHGYRKLKERDSYRIRVGNYRIIYNIFDSELVIDVIQVGHRKDIYK